VIAPRVDLADADEQDDGGPDRGRQPDQERQAALGEGESQPRPRPVRRAFCESGRLTLLLPEGVHNSQGAQRLLDHGEPAALERLRRVPVRAQPPRVDPCDRDQDRGDRDRYERELPVDSHGDVKDPPEHRDSGEQWEQRLDEVADVRRVPVDAIGRVADRSTVVKGEREALHVQKQGGPKRISRRSPTWVPSIRLPSSTSWLKKTIATNTTATVISSAVSD
jgi:hypothetical protein